MKSLKWTKEKIIEGVWEVVNGLNLDRMPTSSEVSGYYGNYKLSNAISKRCLWKPLAKELHLDIKDSETQLGKDYEIIAKEHIINLGYEVESMTQNHPYDLIVDKSLKIDVKVSNLYKGKAGSFYSFNLEKRYGTCDLYILYLIGGTQNGNIIVIPSSKVMGQTQISVGEKNSKYYRYFDRWDFVHKILEFNNNLK